MTAGDMLRAAREAHDLHLDVVAAALKVTPQKLAALEADDIDALPDPVFARALAASVARALRIDPAPVLAKLPGAQPSGLANADRTMSRALPSQARSGNPSGLPSRALLTVVVLLLVGAAAIFWLPQSIFDSLGETVAHITSPSSGDAGEAQPATTTATAAAAPGTVMEQVQPVMPAMPATSGTVATAAPASATPATSAATGSPAAGGDLIVFTAREESWVMVNEAGGKSLLRRTVQSGETVGLTGTLPLTVVIGRASGVDVQVRGKAFDLKPLTKAGGVARFEVKP
ncbi:helix-turn-helix domain-containing protein [Variovorax sp. KK3]|uniref:helix-turn-helix domain-containing protein n=1 Tax=Variovorax sp. KK3 TaxID=1855728 RepID=UPI0021193ABE|nr:helix-turn-helix domain-containing protein [Variovorax sp. KK3]